MAPGAKKGIRTKDELLIELARSRQALAADLPELSLRLNPFARVQRSFARHPGAWFAAAAIAGLIGSRWLLAPSKKNPQSPGKGRKALLRSLPALGWFLKSAWIFARPEFEKILRLQLTSPPNADARPASPEDSA